MATYSGTSARNIWNGTASADTAHGNGGDDSLYGKSGNDTLYGDSGNDGLYGDGGNDIIYGGIGVDALFGGAGNDRLYGGDGNDYISGGSGNNFMLGEAGNDTLVFTARASEPAPNGTGVIDGGAGYDTLVLDAQGIFDQDGARMVFLDLNSATQRGTLGVVADHVEPNGLWFGSVQSIEEVRVVPKGNPVFVSSGTNMKVTGSAGDDYLEGGSGDQVFNGGLGADTFQFQHRGGVFTGNDTIVGFSKAQGDRIQFNDEDEGYTPRVTTSVEQNGHTIYTTTDTMTGKVMHVLDVDTIGLPPPEYYSLG
jgi:Ca2+-binding RTX toxin-like protein